MSTLDELLDALDARDGGSGVSSVRQPRALRRAMTLAVSMGWAASNNDGLNQAVRAQLEAFAQRTALDRHYQEHPRERPDLAEVALALAALDHSPLAGERELVQLAAYEVAAVRPDADADDVLLWAASLQQHGIRPVPRPLSDHDGEPATQVSA